MSDNKTHFGYKTVTPEEKTEKVGAVFSQVAKKYDIMNDAMSFGLHRLWKKMAVQYLNVESSSKVLDLAGGTGDLTAQILPNLGPTGELILADINNAMLLEGRDKLLNKGLYQFHTVQTAGESLPFCDNFFDRIIIGFGLRNFTDKQKALVELKRVLKFGGQLLVLEFSQAKGNLLKKAYEKYSFNFIPFLGKKIAGDEDSYQYLVESIRKHPNQEQLKQMILHAGFDACTVKNFLGGIVAIHQAYVY